MRRVSKGRTLKSVDALIAAFRGVRGLSKWSGESVVEIKRWRRWGFAPPCWQYRMTFELKRHGFDVHPSVFDMAPPRSNRRRLGRGKAA